MKRIGKILCAALLALSISGCAQTQNKEVKILAPSGAPALGVLGAFGQENVSSVDIVSGSDVLQSELAKADSEYDVIVAPSNLGMALSSKGMDNYELAAVITWGNLYLVAEDEDALTKEGNFAAFGEGAVPQLVLENAVDVDNIVPELTYYNAVSDAQSQLLSGKATNEQVQEIWDRLNLFFADAPEDFQTIVDIFNYINTTKKDTDAKFEEYKKILDQKVPIETYTGDKKLFAKEIQKIKSTISKLESDSVTNEVFNLKLTELEEKIREDMNRNILASSGPDVPEELIDGGFWIQTV